MVPIGVTNENYVQGYGGASRGDRPSRTGWRNPDREGPQFGSPIAVVRTISAILRRAGIHVPSGGISPRNSSAVKSRSALPVRYFRDLL